MAVHIELVCEVCHYYDDYEYYVSRQELKELGWVFQDFAPELQCSSCHEEAQNKPRRDALRQQIAELEAELESIS